MHRICVGMGAAAKQSVRDGRGIRLWMDAERGWGWGWDGVGWARDGTGPASPTAVETAAGTARSPPARTGAPPLVVARGHPRPQWAPRRWGFVLPYGSPGLQPAGVLDPPPS